MMTKTLRNLIAGVVATIATLAVLTAGGCSTGVLKGKSCDGAQDKAFAVLGTMLTTLLGLAVKLDALDEPKVKQPTRRASTPDRPQ